MEDETIPVGNAIENTTSHGIDLREWTSSGILVPGVAVLSAGTTLTNIAGDCIRTSTASSSATLNGATLSGCGTGISTVGGGTVVATNTVIEDAVGEGVTAFAGSVILDGVLISNAGAAGINVTGSGEMDGSNVNVVNSVGPALQILGGEAELTGGALESAGTVTVLQTQGDGSLDNVAIVNAETGVHLTGGTLSLTGGTIDDATVEGIHGDAGTLSVDGTDIDGSAGDGIRLDAGVSASVSGAILANSGGFGLNCDGVVTLTQCTLVANGNASGDFQQINGCDAAANAVCGPVAP